MKHLKTILIYCLSLAVIVTFTPAAFAADGAADQTTLKKDGEAHLIHIEGTVLQSDAVDDKEKDGLLDYMNQARGASIQPLKWNDEDESLLINRAAELAINYSDTCLDGTPGPEQYRDRFVEINDDDDMEYDIYLWRHMMNDENFVKDMKNPDNKSFCAGVYVTDDGSKYIAMSFYKKDTNKPSSTLGDYPNSFDLMAKDEYLNVSSSFKCENQIDNATRTNLHIGETYYYWLRNINQRNDEVLFDPLYTHSSKKTVAYIDNHGEITAKKAGVAKLTIRPAKESDISFSKTVVVRPNQTKKVKATSPKAGVIKVSWAKQAGVSGYKVLRSTKKNSGYKVIKTITSASTNTFADTKAKKGSTYYYKVYAYVKYNSKLYPGAKSDPVRCKCKRN